MPGQGPAASTTRARSASSPTPSTGAAPNSGRGPCTSRRPQLIVWYGWKALTARLGPYPSNDHVLGYRIEANERDYICFSVEWALGLACELVLYLGPSTAVLASFVELKRPAARIVWPMAVPVHERIVPRWLPGSASRKTTPVDDP